MLLDSLIKGHMMMEGDGGGGTASGADANGFGGDPVQLDALAGDTPAAGGPSPGDGDGTGDAGPLAVELDGNTYSEADLIGFIEASQNLTAREQALMSRGEDLNALMASMERARGEHMGGPQAPHTPSAANPLEMTGEQMREQMLDNPEEFKANLARYIGEAVTSTVSQQVGDMDSRNTAQTHFTGKHGDFNETVQSPEFADFFRTLPTDAHGQPIYNEVNAYLEFKNSGLQTSLEAAKKAGFDAGAAATRANDEAKSRIKLLRGGGGSMHPAGGNGAPDVRTMPQGKFLNEATQFIIDKRANGQ